MALDDTIATGRDMSIEEKIADLGLELPNLEAEYAQNKAGASFISHYAVGNVLYLSGTVPKKGGQPHLTGLLCQDLTVDQGYEAARYAALTSLSAAKFALGELDRIQRVLHVLGFVNSAPGFCDQPRVINGCTDLLVELFGAAGKPTRAAIGCQGLAANHSVEVVFTLLFDGGEIRAPLERDQAGRGQ